MPIAIELYFDQETERKLRNFWGSLATAGIPSPLIAAGYRPHISLAIFEGFDLDNATGALVGLAAAILPFHSTLSSIGIFPTEQGVLFAGVTTTAGLLETHARCYHQLLPYARQPRDYYLPGRWVPHCTLTNDLSLEDIGRAIPLCRQLGLPMVATIEEIGICEVSPDRCTMLTLQRYSA